MEQEKAKKAAAKKATDKENKILKARAALEVFKDEKRKAGKDDYKDVVMFLVPRLDKDTAPSKVASMKKAKEKLAELASKYNKPWIQLVEDEIAKVCAPVDKADQSENDGVEVTEELWEELKINRDKVLEDDDLEIGREPTLENDGVEDVNPITQASM